MTRAEPETNTCPKCRNVSKCPLSHIVMDQWVKKVTLKLCLILILSFLFVGNEFDDDIERIELNKPIMAC